MWISDGTGGLTHYDFREGEKGAKRFELSTQKIGTVSVNPSSPHLLVTVSNNHFLRSAPDSFDASLLIDLVQLVGYTKATSPRTRTGYQTGHH